MSGQETAGQQNRIITHVLTHVPHCQTNIYRPGHFVAAGIVNAVLQKVLSLYDRSLSPPLAYLPSLALKPADSICS